MGKSKDLATGAAYQDQTESDTRYVNTAGDTMSGTLTIDTASSGVPTINLQHSNGGADNFRIMAGTTGVSNSGFSIRDIDASANRFIIDSSGYVTIPNQPHIYGTVGNTGGEGSSGAGFCNRMYVQTSGGGMTFSNSRITVPVAGVYMVAWQTLTNQSGSGRKDTNIWLNGSEISSGLNNASDAGGDYRMRTHVFARDLAANDYLQFEHDHPYATGAAFDIWSNVSVFLLG